MGKAGVSTASIDIASPEQQASGDFYGRYFWKDYTIEEAGHLDFVVNGLGHDRLMAASTLLDVGAGSGKFSILLKRAYPHLDITSVDISPENIRTIERNASDAGVRIRTREGSALDLPFEDAAFDLVLCVYMLQHTPDPEQGFRESARVLAPGGTALYAVGRENGFGFAHALTRKLFGIVPAGLRRPSVVPLVPLYRALLKARNSAKVTDRDLTIDLVDWFYNPLQKFVSETEIRSWFADTGLEYAFLANTGLLKSMHVCRGRRPEHSA